MDAELQGYLKQIEQIKADARALVAGLSEEQLGRRPAPGRWSIIECLAHLNTSVRVTLPVFDGAIAEARQRGLTGSGPFRYGWFARQIVRSMEPPPRWRMRTKAFLAPGDHPSPTGTLTDFFVVRDELAARLRQADGLDLKRARIRSPVARWLRMPLGAYFAFIITHERRHLWQARQVRDGLR